MKEIKFRQPVYESHRGKFHNFHYWGHIKEGFVSPMQADQPRLSQQWTGLKDKNGKEIYEGDILKLNRHVDDDPNAGEAIAEVMYSDAQFWCTYYGFPLKSFNQTAEVIGNIYENPEIALKS